MKEKSGSVNQTDRQDVLHRHGTSYNLFMQVLTLFSLVVALGIIIPTVNSDALSWAMVTITSVGYGDYVPVTFWGRVLAMVLMIFGIGIFAVLTGFAAAKVVKLQKGPEDIIVIVQEENAAIRAELAALKELLNQRNQETT